MIKTLTTFRFARNRTLDSRSVPVITYEAYRGDEKPFAIFKFFYRSQGKLLMHFQDTLI